MIEFTVKFSVATFAIPAGRHHERPQSQKGDNNGGGAA